MPLLFALIAPAILLPTTAAVAQADGAGNGVAQPKRKRVALVIGNTNYGGASQLLNPVNDAKAMARTLKTMGFTVMELYDQTAPQMVAAINAFRDKLDSDTVALFYFAGHGSQVNGENYLIPVGFKYTSASAMQFDAVPAARVTAILGDAGTPVNIVIIDACRDNPFAGKRGGSRGLSFLKAETGTLIAYATAPGSTADDNTSGENGLYTAALLSEMVRPGLSIEAVFKRVRATVKVKSNNKQTPWESSSLTDDFYFVEANNTAPAPPAEIVGGKSVEVDTKARLKVTCNAPNAVISVAGTTIAGGAYSVNLLDEPTTTVNVKVTAPGYEGKIVAATLERGKILPLAVTLEAIAKPAPMPIPAPVVPPPVVATNAGTGVVGKELSILSGHKDKVLSTAFSRDGKRIVTAGYDGTARVWDAATNVPTGNFKMHNDLVTSASFSRDGRYVMTGSWDSTAKIWDARTGELNILLRGHTDKLTSCAFSRDGMRVVTGSWDKTAKIWDVATGRELTDINGHRDMIESAMFSPDGTRVITASWDKTAKIWDATTGRELVNLWGHSLPVTSAVFSPDGKRVVTGSADKMAKIWDAVTGKLLLTLSGHKDLIACAAFSPDGARVVTASWDKSAKVWDAVSGKELATLPGHTDKVTACAFSPDGTRVITGSYDRTAKVWAVQ